ncbi:MAG TPA: tRNA lysidine(34) synthetase TilS, partial [Burkholderiaceae bacterium]|nr:tRNA lysidine(34) synthetase TilS [Burkholderiaceae bacterium]
MASSRARPRKADPGASPLLQSVRDALARALDQLREEAAQGSEPLKRVPARRGEVVVVALSGGRDSMALLDAAARLARTRGSGIRRLVAVHVHHGLSRLADEWLTHCEAECAARDVPLVARHVEVRRRGRGLEAAAREARYGALAEAARESDSRIVLTAHHREDRLETFLIQWLRGAGVDGLAAFPPSRSFGDDLLLVRPFIDVSRSAIDEFVSSLGIAYVEDDSNDEPAILRNALRADVMPRLDALRPGFQVAAARSIDLVAEAAEAMRSIAEADLAQASDGAPDGMIWLDRITALPLARQTALVRAWLDRAGVESPSRARLLELLDQARTARSDGRLLVRVGDREVRRYRGLMLLKESDTDSHDVQAFCWQGEDEISVPGWGGALRFQPVIDEEGFDPGWLRDAILEVRPRG